MTQPAAALTNCTVSSTSIDGEEQALIAATNDYRVANGLGRLSVSAGLQQTATWMATDMTTKPGFGHRDSLGREFWQRQLDCGYATPGGENIGAGTVRDTGAKAFDLFRNSAAHNAIMLSPEFTEIGVARVQGGPYGWYWAVEFGQAGPAAAAAAAPTVTPAPAAPPPAAAAPAPAAASAPARPSVQLNAGVNMVAWPLDDMSPEDAFAGADVSMVYGYDASTGTWTHYSPGLPSYVQTLGTLHRGATYWVIATGAAQIGG